MSTSSRPFPARKPLALLTLGAWLGVFQLDAKATVFDDERLAFKDRVTFAPGKDKLDHDGFIIYYRDDAAPDDSRSANALRVQNALQNDLARASIALGIQTRAVRRVATGGHVLALENGAMLHADLANRYMMELAKNPDVVSVEPNFRMYPANLTNDPLVSQQWALNSAAAGINIQPAWSLAGTNAVVIAVIDTGGTPHPDLDAKTLAGIDMISDAANARDGDGRDPYPLDQGDWNTANQCGSNNPARPSSWHGTHVAGIAAAITNNDIGIAGAAPSAWIQHVRVLGACGATIADIADGLIWASGGSVPGLPLNNTPARVVNMSLQASAPCTPTYQAAVNSARARNSVVIASAGNYSVPASTSPPGNCTGVISVGSIRSNGREASYSNHGPVVALSAPGGEGGGNNGILSTFNVGQTIPGAASYDHKSGTSMAAPYVSGVAALMLSRNPNLTPNQIATILRNTARPFPTHFNRGGGTGILDAGAAMRAVAGTAPTQYPLSVAITGVGMNAGNVTSAPAQIDCGFGPQACSKRFNANSSVTLTATPSTGYVFSRWEGDCTGTSRTCTLSMNGGKSVHAVFTPPVQALSNGVPVNNLSGATDSVRFFSLQVPEGASHIKFEISGGSGDADLYVRIGDFPNTGTYNCRPYLQGNNEVCETTFVPPGPWYVMLIGASSYSGVRLLATYTRGSGGNGIFCDGMEAQAQSCP